jgi:hypothetical protein
MSPLIEADAPISNCVEMLETLRKTGWSRYRSRTRLTRSCSDCATRTASL